MLLASCWDHIRPIAHTNDGLGSKLFCLDVALKPNFPPQLPEPPWFYRSSHVTQTFTKPDGILHIHSSLFWHMTNWFCTPALDFSLFFFFFFNNDLFSGWKVFFHSGCKNMSVHSNNSEWGGERDRKPPARTALCKFSQERENQCYLKGGPTSDWFICNIKLSPI